MATQRVFDQPADEEFILQQPISGRRARRFLDDYLAERGKTQTTEALFARAGTLHLEELPAPEGAPSFGFKGIVFKGSFVDDANWILVSAREFAIAQEEFLLQHLEGRLRESVSGRLGIDVDRTLESMISAFDDTADDLYRRGYSPSLFVVAGQIGQPLYSDLTSAVTPPYEWCRQVELTPRATHRLIGARCGIPILDIADSPEPTLYAVDLARFATLTRYGRGPDFEPEFDVKPFTTEEAREILARQPRLILDPPPESGQEDERVRQLQLRVGLELWETYELKIVDDGALTGRLLVDPILD